MERKRSHWSAHTVIPLISIALIMILLPLSAAVELPLERQVKGLAGLEYKEAGCSPVQDRGNWGAWRREGHTPTLLEEGRMATAGDGAYLVGGVTTQVVDNFGRSTAALRRYDFGSGSFESLPPLPARLNHVGVAAHDGGIYVVGGLGDKLEFLSEASAALWRYEIATRTWTELAPMPTARGALGAAFVGDTLYAVGGRNGPESYAAVEAFDTTTGHWSARAPLPSRRDHLGVAALGGYVYALGGRRDDSEELAELLRYDPAANRWTQLPDLPRGTSGINLEPVAGELVTTGGEDADQAWVSGSTFAYDPAAERWRELPPSPRAKHGYASAGYDGRLYVFGGSLCAGSTPADTIESLPLRREGQA